MWMAGLDAVQGEGKLPDLEEAFRVHKIFLISGERSSAAKSARRDQVPYRCMCLSCTGSTPFHISLLP